MLAHFPPLPLIVDYADKDRELTVEDEAGVLYDMRSSTATDYCRVV
jgi:hypothetical protein